MVTNIPDQLITSILERECVFFIGSGMSIEAGLPSAGDLVRGLTEILARNGFNHGQKSLDKVAQDFENHRGRAELTRNIRELIVASLGEANRESVDTLASIRPEPLDILTTNWDKLVEESFGEVNIIPIFREDALPSHTQKPGKTNLLKIHGDIDDLMNATITENDLASYSDNHPGFCDKIRTVFRENTLLFIGYSTRDFDFLQNYLKVFEEMKRSSNPRYCVTPSANAAATKRFRNLGVEHLRFKASEFFEILIPKLEEMLVTDHPDFPGPHISGVTEKNPFSIFRAEDMEDKYWKENIFIQPRQYADILSKGNAVIEGHRGSGKSFILLYFSYETQRIIGNDPDFVGVYIKFAQPLVKTAWKRGEERDEWLVYFLGYFNLIFAERLLEILTDWERENIDDEAGFISEISDLYNVNRGGCVSIGALKRVIRSKRASYTKWPRPGEYDVPSDAVESLIEIVREYVKKWRDKDFYVLLDEFDNLTTEQQRVINLLIAARGPTYHEKIYYKVGVKTKEWDPYDIDGKIVEAGDDYTPIILDEVIPKDERATSKYSNFIEDIANRRLDIWGYDNTIRELLPKETSKKRKGFEHNDYSGFDNIVRLSNYLPRDFLELCKDMVFYAYPKIVEEEKQEKLDAISPNIQNTVINLHADLLLTSLERIADPDAGRPIDITRSARARRLIETLGKLFKKILELSKPSPERRTVSEFGIKDVPRLSDEACKALDDCLRLRNLCIPGTRRSPQSKARGVPLDRYALHRLLCAKFKLSLGQRYPRDISARDLNKIVADIDVEKIIDDLTKRFKVNDEPTPPLFDGLN